MKLVAFTAVLFQTQQSFSSELVSHRRCLWFENSNLRSLTIVHGVNSPTIIRNFGYWFHNVLIVEEQKPIHSRWNATLKRKPIKNQIFDLPPPPSRCKKNGFGFQFSMKLAVAFQLTKKIDKMIT